MLRFEFLLRVLLIGSVVYAWHDTMLTVTSEECVKSIIRLTKYYDLMMDFSDDSVPKHLQEQLTPMFQGAKTRLIELLPLAREQVSFQAFPQELRMLSSTRVYCPRESQTATAEPETTTSQPGPGKQEQRFKIAIQPPGSKHKQCDGLCLKRRGKIMKSLARIDSNVRAVGVEVREIARALAKPVPEIEIEETTTSLLTDYPVETDVALAKVEHRLSTDHSYKASLIKDLAIYGASDVRSNVILLMQKIMSDPVAVNYSLSKDHEKRAFDNLELYDVTKRVVWNRFGENFNVTFEMNHGIKAWLRRTPLRLKLQRRKNTSQFNPDALEMAVKEADDLKTIKYN